MGRWVKGPFVFVPQPKWKKETNEERQFIIFGVKFFLNLLIVNSTIRPVLLFKFRFLSRILNSLGKSSFAFSNFKWSSLYICKFKMGKVYSGPPYKQESPEWNRCVKSRNLEGPRRVRLDHINDTTSKTFRGGDYPCRSVPDLLNNTYTLNF